MTDEPRSAPDIKGTPYELFLVLVSLLSIANSAIVLFLPNASVAREVAILMEVVLTPILLMDFLYRLLTAQSRRRYFVRNWGWADLVAAGPALGIFRVFRVRAVVRESRRVGGERISEDLYVNRATSVFLVTIFLVIAVVEFAGIAEFYVEQGQPNANIVSAGDSIWWGLVTITTVGYGDQYPVGPQGRIVGAALLFAGVGLFSVLTGFIANAFLAPDRPRHRARVAPGTPAAELAALNQLLLEHERQSVAIRAKLHDLERAVLSNRGPLAAQVLAAVADGDEAPDESGQG